LGPLHHQNGEVKIIDFGLSVEGKEFEIPWDKGR
jgi:hypothetical protein